MEAKKPQPAGPVTPPVSHLPTAPAHQPLPRQSSTGAILLQPQQPQQQQQQPPSVPIARVLSPLVAGTGTTAAPMATNISNSSSRPAMNEEAQARLAAAAALVSKSVRKSADFNSVTSAAGFGAAGSRASLAEFTGGGFNPASKRSSYAGTPTSRSEFILSGTYSPNYSNSGNQHYPGQPNLSLTAPAVVATATTTSSSSSQPCVAVSSTSPSQNYFYPIYESVHTSSPSLSHQHRDSLTSSKGSLGGEEQQREVMTRIKKSFEQKEEFLKRPALPYWVNVQEANQQASAVPREFYAQPQKFARPVWPPSNPSSITTSFESLPESPTKTTSQTQVKTDGTSVLTSVEPWSMVFTATKAAPQPVSPLGLVTNAVPKPFYGSATNAGGGGSLHAPTPSGHGPAANMHSPTGSKLFISTLSRIQENISSADVTEQQQRKLDLELKPK